MKPQGKKIADYVWLDKTQRSWHIWAGNPFCISLFRAPLSETKEQVIERCKKADKLEKKRFIKLFPDVKWESL
jgi:hypothetical protein